MSDEPGHKAMLYFLEVLMNSNGPLTISQLAGRFGSRSFSAEMRASAGGNEDGLKKFLLKYPSLFTVRGNMVSLYDGKSTGDSDPEAQSNSNSAPTVRKLPDVSAEMAAVQYFQGKLSKKEERWVHIKSLAGHLSQASLEIRNLVGPQLDFRKWLVKHPHIFEVQGELVGLRDGIAAVAQPATPRRTTFSLPETMPLAPKTPPPMRRAIPPKTPPALRRSHSFSEKRAQQFQAQAQAPAGPELTQPPSFTPVARRRAPVTMTANEYKAVMFLKDIVEKKGGIKLHNITGYFSQAAEGVRNTIGWTKMELEEFLKKNAGVFSVTEDELVVVNKNAKLNVIITGSRPQGQGARNLTARKGKIFHVAKLWGIVDLGKHEHVFFDKSIMKKPLDDLQKEYQIGETLYFNAILAPKSSRAKWKATHVWKEHEQAVAPLECEPSDFSTMSPTSALSPSVSIEEEINRFLPASCDSDSRTSDEDRFSDAAVSGTGVIAVWNIGEEDDDPRADVTVVRRPKVGLTKRLVAERNRLSAPCLQDITPVLTAPVQTKPAPPLDGTTNSTNMAKVITPSANLPKVNGEVVSVKKFTEVACQTMSTGDIIATQLYDDK